MLEHLKEASHISTLRIRLENKPDNLDLTVLKEVLDQTKNKIDK